MIGTKLVLLSLCVDEMTMQVAYITLKVHKCPSNRSGLHVEPMPSVQF